MINIGNDESDGGMGGKDIYNGKRKELILASLSESYSELDAISIDTSSTLLVYLILFNDYLYYQLLT